MDTGVLISFVEAERNKIDPKHRSLECDKLAYGIIARVFDGIYAAKCQAERDEALANMTPEERAAQQPQSTPQEGGYPVQTATGITYYAPYQANKRLEDGRQVTDCLFCGKGKPNANITCGKNPCPSKFKTALLKARRAAGKYATSQQPQGQVWTRPCLNCGRTITVNRRHHMFCKDKENLVCAKKVQCYNTAYHQTMRTRGGIPTTPAQHEAFAFMEKVKRERERLGVN